MPRLHAPVEAHADRQGQPVGAPSGLDEHPHIHSYVPTMLEAGAHQKAT